MRRLSFLLAMAPVPAVAQTVVISDGPDALFVTAYRAPDRGDAPLNRAFPGGYALISETRRIALPAGQSLIRFEGVAEGMIAVSAVVTGLPGGVVQKNRDARLLSPAALIDGSFGRTVHLRRTDPATGRVTEEDAVLRSTADNALVLETAQGIEGLRCSGLPETVTTQGLPPGLSPRPTLSVDTSSPAATQAQVTLTYLATGFDWDANYVAHLAPDGRTLDLFAWLTVANGNAQSFDGAELLAVAGKVNRDAQGGPPADRWTSPQLNLQCWRFDGYGSEQTRMFDALGAPPPPAPPPPPMAARAESIVVTAARVARQEELGDLKLYRVPMRVDVNAKGQKQVALLDRKGIAVTSLYGARIDATADMTALLPLNRRIRFANDRRSGAGLPLPAGDVALFAFRAGAWLPLAQAPIRDHAIGEKVELDGGPAPGRYYRLQRLSGSPVGAPTYRLTLTNAAAEPMVAEIALDVGPDRSIVAPSRPLKPRDGMLLWTATVPANGSVSLDYRLRAPGWRVCAGKIRLIQRGVASSPTQSSICTSSFSLSMICSSWPVPCDRKTSAISPVPSMKVNQTPRMVAMIM